LLTTVSNCTNQNPVIVSVIILNYNGSQYLESLFSSLNNQSLPEFEIVFVDNASSDNSVNLAKQLSTKLRKGLSIKIIENDQNLGYCGGNNIGASLIMKSVKYLVFLNNDTYLDTNWLRELVTAAESDKTIGVVGSRIADPMQNSSICTVAFACDFYGQTEGIPLCIPNQNNADLQELKLFYCSGASFLIPKKVFSEIGGFDEALFMYHDEIDLCWRVRLSDYKIMIAFSSICYHITKSTASGLSLPVWKYYQGIVKNRLRVLFKNYTEISFLKHFSQAVVLISLRGLLSFAVNRNVCYITALIKGVFWNIKNLRSTLLKRFETQKLRKVSDNVIFKTMCPYSLEIAYFKAYFKKNCSI
jgi:GT2 family glycosyltransferase